MHTKKMVALCFCAVVVLFGAAAEAGVFCPTECKIKTVPFEHKIWFMIDMPESVRMDLYVGKSIDANGNIPWPTVFDGGHQGRDWNVAVQNVELDTLYYYKLQVTNQDGRKSSKHGAVWSNQLNLRLWWSHLYVKNANEEMGGLAELKVRLYVDGQYPPALEVGSEHDGWADDDHTYNVNKEKVFTNLKQNQMNLRLSPLERDPGVHEMNYVDYILDFTGPGWSSQGKKEFSMSTLNQSPPQVEAFFRAQTVYAVAEERPVPNMSHLDSKPTLLANPEVLKAHSKPPVFANAEDSPILRRITVKSPNGGEKWTAGQTKTITWTALGVPVMIVLRKGDVPVQVLSPNEAPAMQGSFTWHIPWNVPPGDDYKIRVRNMDNSIRDDSDGPFSITKMVLKPGLPKP